MHSLRLWKVSCRKVLSFCYHTLTVNILQDFSEHGRPLYRGILSYRWLSCWGFIIEEVLFGSCLLKVYSIWLTLARWFDCIDEFYHENSIVFTFIQLLSPSRKSLTMAAARPTGIFPSLGYVLMCSFMPCYLVILLPVMSLLWMNSVPGSSLWCSV